jgi:diacylglycerol kinase
VHFFFGALAGVAAFVLRRSAGEWCVLLLCLGMVLVAELFNSAFETLVHGLEPETRTRVSPALGIASGAVLMASLTAAIVGLIVLANRLLESPV